MQCAVSIWVFRLWVSRPTQDNNNNRCAEETNVRGTERNSTIANVCTVHIECIVYSIRTQPQPKQQIEICEILRKKRKQCPAVIICSLKIIWNCCVSTTTSSSSFHSHSKLSQIHNSTIPVLCVHIDIRTLCRLCVYLIFWECCVVQGALVQILFNQYANYFGWNNNSVFGLFPTATSIMMCLVFGVCVNLSSFSLSRLSIRRFVGKLRNIYINSFCWVVDFSFNAFKVGFIFCFCTFQHFSSARFVKCVFISGFYFRCASDF